VCMVFRGGDLSREEGKRGRKGRGGGVVELRGIGNGRCFDAALKRA
jgi:hypothetical protein